MKTAPLAERISVGLRVGVGGRNDRTTGDLDNFITGVCDALMAAAPGTPWHDHPLWSAAENAVIRPDRAIGILDDSQILEVRASKVICGSGPWYEVTLTDEAVPP